MNSEQIVEWVKDYQNRNPDDESLENLLEAFQEELLCIMIKKLGDKS